MTGQQADSASDETRAKLIEDAAWELRQKEYLEIARQVHPLLVTMELEEEKFRAMRAARAAAAARKAQERRRWLTSWLKPLKIQPTLDGPSAVPARDIKQKAM